MDNSNKIKLNLRNVRPGRDRLLAALDIGTNSVLLLVCRPGGGKGFSVISEAIRMPRLGENVGSTGRLCEPAVERTLAAVAELLQKLPPGSHGRGVAAATSAVRDAVNRDIFLTAFGARFGGAPLLLSGAREAALIFSGVARGMGRPDTLLVNIDVGGGSTEISAGDREGKCVLSRSLDIGCVRLGEQYGLYEASGPLERRLVREAVARRAGPVIKAINALAGRRPIMVVASGGTATSFVAWQLQMKKFDRDRVHGFQASETRVAQVARELAAMPLTARVASPFIAAGRAAVMPAGLLILSEIVRRLRVDRFTVTVYGLRYGLIAGLLSGDLEPSFSWPSQLFLT